MLWWILLLILVVLLLLPVGLVAEYRDQRWDVFLRIGPAKIRLYPNNKRKKAVKTNSVAKNTGKQKATAQELKDFLPILQSLFAFLADFRRSVKVNDLLIRIVLAGSDPCDVGVHYGYTCAAIANLLPLLNRLLYVKRQKIDVSCDYLGDESIIEGSLDISLPMILFLKLVLQYGLRIFKHYHSIKTKEKAV